MLIETSDAGFLDFIVLAFDAYCTRKPPNLNWQIPLEKGIDVVSLIARTLLLILLIIMYLVNHIHLAIRKTFISEFKRIQVDPL